MIKGIKYHNLTSIRYDQRKNATEAIIKKVKNSDTGYLESCGASAFCTLMEGMGYITEENRLRFPTKETIQMDDAVMNYLNDPRNDRLFSSGKIFDNRIYQNYTTLARMLFDVKAILDIDDFNKWAANLTVGNGVQVVMKEPGHFLALVAYDAERDVILYHDSWGTRNIGKPALKNGGVLEELTRDDMDNFKDVSIIYLKG